MKERINIWKNKGCILPNGGLCTACCVLPEVELDGIYTSIAKPAHSPCPNLGNGCNLQNTGTKPGTCVTWHCSMANSDGKIDLVAQALSLGIVSEEEAVSVGGVEVLSKAKYLTKITYNRELIERDLNEP